MLAVINVRDKPVLDPVLLRHQPLRYGQSIKADNNRISEETRRTRCSRVSMRLPTISYISFILFLNVFFFKGSLLHIGSFTKMAQRAKIISR